MIYFSKDLVEQFLDFLGAQWAAVSDFAKLSIFDNFANFSGSGEFEFGTDRADISIEEGGDFVVVSDGTSREIADQSSVALSGFLSGQDGIDGITVFFGRSLSTSGKSGSEDNSFEDGNTTEESQRNSRGRGYGISSTGGNSSSCSKNEGSISYRGKGNTSNGVGNHAKEKNNV